LFLSVSFFFFFFFFFPSVFNFNLFAFVFWAVVPRIVPRKYCHANGSHIGSDGKIHLHGV
jgi:hypothetical protein